MIIVRCASKHEQNDFTRFINPRSQIADAHNESSDDFQTDGEVVVQFAVLLHSELHQHVSSSSSPNFDSQLIALIR